MSRLKIDVVAPPFAGHLHPILGVARILREFGDVRVLTTPDVAARVEAAGFELLPILSGQVGDVWHIANTSSPVRGRPWMLLRQFRANLRLLPVMRHEIETAWQTRRPDLALVDFTLPSIGHWAQACGIRWWTSHPSPLAIETPDGTPSYLGGWMPPVTWVGRLRDAAGRKAVRGFKRTLFSLFAHKLRHAGLARVYRPDQTEAAYSDEVILALGSPKLEFPQTWPKAVRFVGPAYFTPDTGDASPQLDSKRKNILVTIGTHLPYARHRLIENVQAWAAAMPDLFFHYTTGGDAALAGRAGENWRVYRYLNYEQTIGRFDAVVHHGGCGIAYHVLRAAIPAIAWPQDYDQFDFAARLSHRGLAVRCRRSGEIPQAIRRALGNEQMHHRAKAFAHHLQENDQRALLLRILQERGLLSRDSIP